MTPRATQISSKKFAKSFEGFWTGSKVNTTLTKKANPLQMQGYPNLSTVDTP